MNLQIGTILIAKEDKKNYTKGKEYAILEKDGNLYRVENDTITVIEWFDERRIDQHFTIKRYTLQDLKDKKIAVKLRNYDEYKKMCEAVGDTFNGENTYGDIWEYYGFEGIHIVYMNEDDLQGRTLLESIDEIDLEVKEDVKETYTCKYCGATLSKDVKEEDCYANPNKNHDSTTDTLIIKLESEIARLKGVNEELKAKYNNLFNRFHDVVHSPTIASKKTTQSPDQAKRERMAWELFLRDDELSIDGVFNTVDLFLAKSEEVKP